MKTLRLLTSLILLGVARDTAQGESNFAVTSSKSWSANAGWLEWQGDALNGVHVDQFVCAGFIYAANFGWIDMGRGQPANGIAYQNNSAADFGVNLDANGNLRGTAWGANVGWINFETLGQPRVDLTSGRLSGFAWGANIGWINLGDATFPLQLDGVADGNDADADGIPDAWEVSYVGNLTTLTAAGDADRDGVSDLAEYFADTDPTDALDSLRIASVLVTADRAGVELKWPARPTRQYQVQVRSALNGSDPWRNASAAPITTQRPSAAQIVPLSTPRGPTFFRILATRPLAR